MKVVTGKGENRRKHQYGNPFFQSGISVTTYGTINNQR